MEEDSALAVEPGPVGESARASGTILEPHEVHHVPFVSLFSLQGLLCYY